MATEAGKETEPEASDNVDTQSTSVQKMHQKQKLNSIFILTQMNDKLADTSLVLPLLTQPPNNPKLFTRFSALLSDVVEG